MKNYCTLTLLWITMIHILPQSILAQDRWVVPRLQSEIIFDGLPDEDTWDNVEAFPMTTHIPTFGIPPSEESVIKLAYDDKYLYLGALLYVSDPEYIQAVGKKRDYISPTSDWIGICLDTYNDNENAFMFFTNPNGCKFDAAMSNDATIETTTDPMNMNWNTFWDSRVTMDDQGWYVEMRIPISSLRFQESKDKTVMGISIFRWIPAKDEGYIFPAISNEWGQYSQFKPSKFAKMELESLLPKKALYISPYLLAGVEQFNELNVSETAYDYNRDLKTEPGLDLKYGINPNTILDLTINTDFAQVEADDQQFNLTRYSLVYPEKRMFFLEQSSIFDFGLGGGNALFYSRRIGLHEGEPVRILGGARLISRVNGWDFGFMDLQTASLDNLPAENFGVLRTRKRVFNDYSYAGGMITSRIGADGTYNLAYGLDGVIKLMGNEYLTVRWSQTFKDNSDIWPISLDPSRLFLLWERRKEEGFTYSALLTYSGTEFDPGIGLEVFDDYLGSREILKYIWISPESSWLLYHYITLMNYNIHSAIDGKLLTFGTRPGWFFNSKNSWMGSIYLIYNYEFLQEDFEIFDPVIVPAGDYQFYSTSLLLNTPSSMPFKAQMTFEGGGYYDGSKISPMIKPSWNIGTGIELGGIYRFDYVNFPDRDQTLKNHIAGLTAVYMLNTKLSFSAFVQYNTAIEKVITNFRFRYNPKEGTDLYLVFNEGRNTLLDRELPTLPIYDHRSVMIKFTYTFER